MSDFKSVADILRERTITKPKESIDIAFELVAVQLLKRELAERKANEQGLHKIA